MHIFVDADACPKACLQTVLRLAERDGIPVTTVASFHHQIARRDHITVADGPDAVDWEIVKRVSPGDLVVTQDSGLASIVVAKQAAALHPTGRFFSPEMAAAVLEERALKARCRRQGMRTKGPKPRRFSDDDFFARQLDRWLRRQPSKGSAAGSWNGSWMDDDQ